MSDKAKFSDGQDVEFDTDLQYMEDQRVGEQDTRFGEISGSYGILIGLALSNPTPYELNVGAGVAYAKRGPTDSPTDVQARTIRVISGDSYANRAAPLSLTFSGGDAGKLVCLAYNEANDATTNPQVDPVTGADLDTRVLCYPTVALRNAKLTGEVVIGNIDQIDGSGNCTFSTDTAEYWGARLTPQQLADLSEALSQIYGHHQQDHVSGIETVGPGGDPGAITIDGATLPNEVNVTDMVAKDSLLVYYKRLGGSGQLTGKNIKFTDVAVTAEPQLWGIYVDTDGACNKMLLAQYQATTNIPGLQLVDVCPFGIPYPTSLTIEHYKPGGTHFLRLAGHSTISPTSNGFYHLRRDDDPDIGVLVYVTVGSLPSGGSSGSPHQDVITVNTSYFDDPPVTINDGVVGGLLLGTVYWYGTALLGYGTWATTGSAYDKRNYGNLADDNISDAFKERLVDMIDETRAFGFVGPPRLFATTLSLDIIIQRADSRADLDDIEESPYAYISGKKVRIPITATFTLPTNVSRVVYLEDNGDGTSTWGIQNGSGTMGIPLATGRMPCWNLQTDGTGVIYVEDLTITLPRIDREAVRLGRRNVGAVHVGDPTNADSAESARIRVDVPLNAIVSRSAALSALVATGQLTWDDDADVRGLGWTIYTYNPGDTIVQFELVLNAYWDKDAALWRRRTTGQPSSIIRLAVNGLLRVYKRDDGSADTWTDTFDAAGWDTLHLEVSSSGHTLRGETRALVRVADSLSDDAELQGTGTNINSVSVVTSGTDRLRITFDTPYADTDYEVHATVGPVNAGDGSGHWPIAEPNSKTTSTVDIVFRDPVDSSVMSLTSAFVLDLYVNVLIKGRM